MGEIKTTLGVIGAGSMGGAIARGLVLSGALDPADVVVADPAEACCAPLAELGIGVATDAYDLVTKDTGVVIIAVKPQILAQVVAPLSAALEGRLVVSIAAGTTLATLEQLLPASRVVRVMPNLPIQVLSGATAITGGTRATAADLELVRSLFSALGSAQIMREDQLDAEGAVVSCGPAYVALAIDAFTRAGVRAGLPASACREMFEATMLGVCKTLLETGEHPRAYMERVTSPGGTTAAGLYALEPLLEEGAYAACDAALARTAELAQG
ncbi:MAG: pyrroline-5-carboxylate reductase [Coriobacteriales bacterium]|nr:pyrroline-5-carboxylate reductase [Coriobacteriales bacterium]